MQSLLIFRFNFKSGLLNFLVIIVILYAVSVKLLNLFAVCIISPPEVFEFAEIVEIHHRRGFETESTVCRKNEQEERLRVCIFECSYTFSVGIFVGSI